MNKELSKGDIISYSSGTTSADYDSYRTIKSNFDPFVSFIKKQVDWWNKPQKTPILVNAYPATIINSKDTILVDSYLNQKTASRALAMAAAKERPAILVAQSLFAADIIHYHLQTGQNFPQHMVLITGGYYMPFSLEKFIRNCINRADRKINVFHCYGLAEVEMGCLVADSRDEYGNPRYYERDNLIETKVENGTLRISLKNQPGDYVVKEYNTRDKAQIIDDHIILNRYDRICYEVLTILESWDWKEWSRRTGYMKKIGHLNYVFQVRSHGVSEYTGELPYYQFSDLTGNTFLSKPDWLGKAW